MTTSLIVPALAWTLALASGILAAAGYVRMARADGGWRDPGCWHAPLIFTALALPALADAGAVPPLTAALLALLPLAVVALIVSRAWREVARQQGALTATRIVGAGLLGRLREALSMTWEDLRDLARRRRGSLPDPDWQYASPGVPEAAPPRQVPAPAQPARPVPPARPVQPAPPGPSAEAAYLPASALPPGWAALCAEIDGFEADTDEEVLGFIAAQLAGHMAHAESVRDLADRMMHGTGLDPAFAQGVATYADENADMTGSVTMLDRMFHAIYDALRIWADEHPMGMPHRAREFLQGGEPPLPDAGDDSVAA